MEASEAGDRRIKKSKGRSSKEKKVARSSKASGSQDQQPTRSESEPAESSSSAAYPDIKKKAVEDFKVVAKQKKHLADLFAQSNATKYKLPEMTAPVKKKMNAAMYTIAKELHEDSKKYWVKKRLINDISLMGFVNPKLS